jgi:hypothetical protein
VYINSALTSIQDADQLEPPNVVHRVIDGALHSSTRHVQQCNQHNILKIHNPAQTITKLVWAPVLAKMAQKPSNP